jgi:hypothetical protein
MRYSTPWSTSEAESPPRNSRNSPSEQTDDAPDLIEKDQVDIEREIPTDDTRGSNRSIRVMQSRRRSTSKELARQVSGTRRTLHDERLSLPQSSPYRRSRGFWVPVAPTILGYPKAAPPPVPRNEPQIRWVG